MGILGLMLASHYALIAWDLILYSIFLQNSGSKKNLTILIKLIHRKHEKTHIETNGIRTLAKVSNWNSIRANPSHLYPNQFEKRFESPSMQIGLKSIRLKPNQTVTPIQVRRKVNRTNYYLRFFNLSFYFIEYEKSHKKLQSDANYRFLHSHHGWEGISFMWKMTFEIFMKSLRFETPWVRKKGFYESVCLSVGL